MITGSVFTEDHSAVGWVWVLIPISMMIHTHMLAELLCVSCFIPLVELKCLLFQLSVFVIDMEHLMTCPALFILIDKTIQLLL